MVFEIFSYLLPSIRNKFFFLFFLPLSLVCDPLGQSDRSLTFNEPSEENTKNIQKKSIPSNLSTRAHSESLEEIRLQASAWLSDLLAQEYESFKLTTLKHDKGTQQVWTCTHSFQYSLSNPSTKNSRLSVLAQCQKPRWSLLTAFHQEIYEEVAYLNKDFRPSHLLLPEDISWKKENILTLHRQYLTKSSIHQVLGMKAKKSLSKGDLIRPQHWKIADIIKKNQKVDILYKKSGLHIQATGKACENGYIGKLITVENIRSKTKVQAMVVNEHTVEVR